MSFRRLYLTGWLSQGWIAMALLAIPAHAQQTHVEKPAATDDECRIVATTLHTATKNPLDSTSFGAACDWQRLGLAVETTNAAQGWSTFVLPLKFSPDHASAVVEYVDHYKGERGFVGFSTHDCTALRRDGQWSVGPCKTVMIAN